MKLTPTASSPIQTRWQSTHVFDGHVKIAHQEPELRNLSDFKIGDVVIVELENRYRTPEDIHLLEAQLSSLDRFTRRTLERQYDHSFLNRGYAVVTSTDKDSQSLHLKPFLKENGKYKVIGEYNRTRDDLILPLSSERLVGKLLDPNLDCTVTTCFNDTFRAHAQKQLPPAETKAVSLDKFFGQDKGALDLAVDAVKPSGEYANIEISEHPDERTKENFHPREIWLAALRSINDRARLAYPDTFPANLTTTPFLGEVEIDGDSNDKIPQLTYRHYLGPGIINWRNHNHDAEPSNPALIGRLIKK